MEGLSRQIQLVRGSWKLTWRILYKKVKNRFCFIYVMEAIGGSIPLEEVESQESKRWKVCGSDVPRSEIVFFSQVIII